MMEVDAIYTITLSLKPKSKGILVIQQDLITEHQYNALKSASQVGLGNKTNRINYGETADKGFVLVSSTLGYKDILPRIEKMLLMVTSLIMVGLQDVEEAKDKRPRPELQFALDHLQTFTEVKGIPQMLDNANFGFNAKDIVFFDRAKADEIITNIVDIATDNIKSNYGNDFFEDFDKQHMQKAHILVGFFYFAIVLLANIGYNVNID